MSLDLRLLPIDCVRVGGAYSFTVLNAPVPRRYAAAIEKLAEPVPKGFEISAYGARVPSGRAKGECMYGVLTTTAFGERYAWITAGDLDPILSEHAPTHPTTAYIKALPPGTYVVLDWH